MQADSRPSLLPLLRAAQHGDAEAMHRLVEHVYPALEDFLRRRLGTNRVHSRLVEDALQEAALRLLRSLHQFRGQSEGQAWSWVLRVTWHAAVDSLRAGELPAQLLRSAPYELLASEAVAESDISRDWRASEDRASVSPLTELARIAARCQEEFSPTLQELLWLRVVQDASWSDIGVTLGVATSAAKRRFQRAQRRLRRCIALTVQSSPEPSRSTLIECLRRLEDDDEDP